MLIDFSYLNLPGKLIEDKEDFYRSGIQEASKIRNLCTTCQRLFVTNSKYIDLYILGEKDIYKIDVKDNKRMIAQLYYLPKQLRLDLYDGGNPESPLFIWKSKKCIRKNIPGCLEVVKIETIFLPLISIL